MQKNRQIVHLNFAKGYRGGERQTQLLIEELSHRGYQQKIFTRKKSELALRLNSIKNLEIISISKPYIFHINEIQNTKLIHAHETKAAQVAYLIHLLYKLPYLITRRVNNPISNNFFNKKIYTKSTYTIVLSNAIKNTTLNLSNNINIKIIPSAYTQLTTHQEKIENIKQRFENNFLIGNIGELDNDDKGQYYLIEAMKKLQIEYPNIHLILLGQGKDEENYKKQAKGLKNITFEGFVNNVGDYISCLDLFVFPSLNEGLGSILLDIIQAKVSIIASNVGGIPDIIEHKHTGILIEAKDSDAIYNEIVKLYHNQTLRENLAREAFKTIEEYSINSMTNQYEKLYRSVDNA
ncbi:MAG TPA: glycosyltransferase family 1 protein [Hydrogenothermaceae bacterium]|nr:glycosyltransferase family 1 protein [Hydrogenothermaceae bacterium]